MAGWRPGRRSPGDKKNNNDVAIEFLRNMQLTWKRRWGRGKMRENAVAWEAGQGGRAVCGPCRGPGGEGEGESPSRWAGLGGGLWCGLSGEGGALGSQGRVRLLLGRWGLRGWGSGKPGMRAF